MHWYADVPTGPALVRHLDCAECLLLNNNVCVKSTLTVPYLPFWSFQMAWEKFGRRICQHAFTKQDY